jgi:hypothetical protein
MWVALQITIHSKIEKKLYVKQVYIYMCFLVMSCLVYEPLPNSQEQ